MLIDERHLGQDASALPMPATIHAVLAARSIDSTPPSSRSSRPRPSSASRSATRRRCCWPVGATPPSWSLISARWCASRSSRRTADASAAEGRSASSTSSCATWPTRASSRRGAPIFMSATRTGWSARRASARASTRRSSGTTSSVPSATCPSWRRPTSGDPSWPLAPPATWARPVAAPSREATFARRSACSSEPFRCFRTMTPPDATSRSSWDRPGRERRPVPRRRATRRPDPG